MQNWPHILLKSNVWHRIKTIYLFNCYRYIHFGENFINIWGGADFGPCSPHPLIPSILLPKNAELFETIRLIICSIHWMLALLCLQQFPQPHFPPFPSCKREITTMLYALEYTFFFQFCVIWKKIKKIYREYFDNEMSIFF